MNAYNEQKLFKLLADVTKAKGTFHINAALALLDAHRLSMDWTRRWDLGQGIKLFFLCVTLFYKIHMGCFFLV